MNNLQLILNFMEQHPVLSILIVCSVFSWTPVKVINNCKSEDDDE
jgi:hypothetical protein